MKRIFYLTLLTKKYLFLDRLIKLISRPLNKIDFLSTRVGIRRIYILQRATYHENRYNSPGNTIIGHQLGLLSCKPGSQFCKTPK